MVAVASLLGVVLHDRRHEIRRMLNGGRALRDGSLQGPYGGALGADVLVLTTLFWKITFTSGCLRWARAARSRRGKRSPIRNIDLAREVEALREAKEKKVHELQQAAARSCWAEFAVSNPLCRLRRAWLRRPRNFGGGRRRSGHCWRWRKVCRRRFPRTGPSCRNSRATWPGTRPPRCVICGCGRPFAAGSA